MVAIDKIKTVFAEEPGQKQKRTAVHAHNVLETAAFPKLVAVAKLDVGVVFIVIMSQGGKIEILVLGEIIRPAAVAPVAIAHQNDP
jgi:hypothetical protein